MDDRLWALRAEYAAAGAEADGWQDLSEYARAFAAGLDEAASLIRDLTDPDPCWFDHHGYCQAHGWMETVPSCPHARAKAFVRRQPENDNAA